MNKNKLTSMANRHKRPALLLGSVYRHCTDSTQTLNFGGQNIEWLIHNLSIYLDL
jgi:hypothetical protein